MMSEQHRLHDDRILLNKCPLTMLQNDFKTALIPNGWREKDLSSARALHVHHCTTRGHDDDDDDDIGKCT